MDAYSQLFSNLEKYITLTEPDKKLLQENFKPVNFSRKQYVLKEGEVARFTNFVVKGCLRSYYRDENGFAHVLMFGVENWWISDLNSYMYDQPASLFIDALEDTLVLQICRKDMDSLYLKIPALERFFRIITQYSLANIQDRIIGNLSKPATERYLFFREKYGFLEGRLPQNQIASYLGVTPEFLSIIRKKLSRSSSKI